MNSHSLGPSPPKRGTKRPNQGRDDSAPQPGLFQLTRGPRGHDSAESMSQKHTASPRLILGVATLLGAFSTFQAYNFVRLFSEHKQPLFSLAVMNFSFWYGWALLAPIVLWVARRFPLERGIWKRSVPVHLIAVLVLIFVHVMFTEWVFVTVPKQRVAGPAHLVAARDPRFHHELRLGDDDLLRHHRLQSRRQLLPPGAGPRAPHAQLETRLAEAQLQALQRQLHPHFLFNTLNGISALMHRDVLAADRMLVRLSDLLRMALDRRSAQEVPLTDDLDSWQVPRIEQARFGDRLAVRFDIDPETLDALVPNLLLQPLVENSVRHAVAARSEGGFVEVTPGGRATSSS